MLKYNCPACGADILFQSAASTFTVCSYCRATLVRHDLNLEQLGKMAQLKEDASPLQLGTTGRFDKVTFTLLGRVQLSWQDGFWNEWFIRLANGKDGWLAEAQGFYMVSLATNQHSLVSVENLRPGTAVEIAKVTYTVDDVKAITTTFAEGELPFAAPQGRQSVSIDLSHGEYDFASVSAATGSPAEVFVGRYQDFADFAFQNLKVIDGW